jgi:hypothetical protein
MRYLCLIYLNEDEMAALPAEEVRALNVGHLALNQELRTSGHLVEAYALRPSTDSVTVRPRSERTTVMDGPFTEAKELVAGFYLLECRDIDEAVAIASRFPGARHGAVEVRPVMELEV